jgi:hypothetical protein
MADQLVASVNVSNKPLPGQDDRCSQDFNLQNPGGYLKFRFEFKDVVPPTGISVTLSKDVFWWPDWDIREGIQNLTTIDATSWPDVYFSDTHNAKAPFNIQIYATSPGVAPASVDETAQIQLIIQPVFTGLVGYAAIFPPPTFSFPHAAIVRSLKNPNLHAIAIIKYGHSTADASNPNNIVVLLPGATTTPAQMNAIFQSATPAVPINIVAIANYSSATDLPNVLWITINYTLEN